MVVISSLFVGFLSYISGKYNLIIYMIEKQKKRIEKKKEASMLQVVQAGVEAQYGHPTPWLTLRFL